jgi:hypothetical protein
MLLSHHLEQGASKSALARQLGISRDTMHRWIRSGDLERDLETMPVRYGPRRPVPTKLDAYKGILETRLAAYHHREFGKATPSNNAFGVDCVGRSPDGLVLDGTESVPRPIMSL